MFEKKEEMGYDSAITIFSPDGRLFQVEYAIEAVRHGSPIIGIRSEEGVVLVAKKRETPELMEAKSTQKIFRIDDHIGSAISGLHADARLIIDYARVQAQIEKLTYYEPIMVETLIKKISDMKQVYTQQAGVRPFGVSLMVAGVDANGPHLFSTDPSGTYYGWRANVIGKDGKIKEIIEKEYKESLTLDESIFLGLKAIAEDKSEEKIKKEIIEIGIVRIKDKIFRILEPKEIDNYINKL